MGTVAILAQAISAQALCVENCTSRYPLADIMGAGASAGVSAAAQASSIDDITLALKGLPESERAKLASALAQNKPAAEEKKEEPKAAQEDSKVVEAPKEEAKEATKEEPKEAPKEEKKEEPAKKEEDKPAEALKEEAKPADEKKVDESK